MEKVLEYGKMDRLMKVHLRMDLENMDSAVLAMERVNLDNMKTNS